MIKQVAVYPPYQSNSSGFGGLPILVDKPLAENLGITSDVYHCESMQEYALIGMARAQAGIDKCRMMIAMEGDKNEEEEI